MSAGAATAAKLWGYARLIREWRAIRKEVTTAPDRWIYSDAAITPIREEDNETLSLYQETNGGEAALARQRRHDAIRTRVQPSAARAIVPDSATAG
jgi:hypothetical protein